MFRSYNLSIPNIGIIAMTNPSHPSTVTSMYQVEVMNGAVATNPDEIITIGIA